MTTAYGIDALFGARLYINPDTGQVECWCGRKVGRVDRWLYKIGFLSATEIHSYHPGPAFPPSGPRADEEAVETEP